jgi:hypothetical protein
MNRRADERSHLMLQILLMTEKEITAALGIDRQIVKQLGIENVANSTEIRELSQRTSIDDMAQTIKESVRRLRRDCRIRIKLASRRASRATMGLQQ